MGWELRQGELLAAEWSGLLAGLPHGPTERPNTGGVTD